LEEHFNSQRVVSTTMNLAAPLNMRSYASAVRSSGNSSIIGLTPDSALKVTLSGESIEVPDGNPLD
jgi:hypothetical protein